jgi:hypothetical protein
VGEGPKLQPHTLLSHIPKIFQGWTRTRPYNECPVTNSLQTFNPYSSVPTVDLLLISVFFKFGSVRMKNYTLFFRPATHNADHSTSILNFLLVVLGFRDFVYEFQKVSINHTGIFTRGLRTECIPFSCNRAAGSTLVLFSCGQRGWLGGWKGRQWIPLCDAQQRWKTQIISPYERYVSRCLCQSVA